MIMDVAANVRAYYRTIVEPTRLTLLKTHRDLAVGVGSPVEQVVDDLVADFPRHRRPERPTLTYIGWRLAGGTPDSLVPAKAAIAWEFGHSGGLIHDDIVDGSPTRNWKPTVWADYAAKHAHQPWSTEFGHSVAIWLGNLLWFWSQDIFADALIEVPPPAAHLAKNIWTRTLTELWASQHLDLVEAPRGTDTDSTENARTVARLKGRYVAAMPLQLGAALAGGTPELLAALADYGHPLGEAYIFRNDLEGVFADPTTADHLPDDLRERRLSLLLATAHERASAEQARLLRRAGNKDLSDQDVAAIKTILVDTDARDDVEHLSQSLAEQALTALDHDLITPWARPLLATAAHQAMTRHQINQPGRHSA